MKDLEKANPDSSQDAPHVVKPKGHSHAEGQDASHVASQPASHAHADPAALSAPELSHPANAAPLANLLTQLQQSHGNVHVQRVVADMNESRSESQPRGSGQALDAGVKTQMESAFGENFGDVRIHSDSAAERMNEELGARAVTHGRDIYFGSGQYSPSTRDGKEILAHELTHVIQQEESSRSQQANTTGQVGDVFEQEAQRAAAAIVRDEPVHVERKGAPAYQRDQRGAQQTPQPPRQAPAGGFMNVTINVTAQPTGTLPNGVVFRYVPAPPEPYLDFVIPADMHVSAESPRNRTLVQKSKESTSAGQTVRAAQVLVTPVAGQTAVVRVTFRQGNIRGFAIFNLPRFP